MPRTAKKKAAKRSTMFSGVHDTLGKIDPNDESSIGDESDDDIQMMEYEEDAQLTETDDDSEETEETEETSLYDRIKDLYNEDDDDETEKTEDSEEEDEDDSEESEDSEDGDDSDDDADDRKESAEDEDEDPDLTNDDGSKPTEKTKVFIKSLKDKKKQAEADLIATRKELEELKAAAGSTEEIEAVKKELTDLKEKLGVIHFEQSPEFIDKYIKPISSAAQKAAKIAGNAISDADEPQVKKSWNDAITYLDSGNENQYFNSIAEIADMIDNETQKRRFEAAAANAWDKKEEHLSAAEDMTETRKQLETEEFNAREKTAINASGKFEKVFTQFERDNERILGIYRNNDTIFKYDETVRAGRAKVSEGLKKFYTTGVLPDELASILVSGSVHQVQLNEREAMLKMIEALNKRLEAKSGAIDKLKKRTKGKSGGGTLSNGGRRPSSDDQPKGSSLMENVRNALKVMRD